MMERIVLTETDLEQINAELFAEEVTARLGRQVMVASRQADARLIEAVLQPTDGLPFTGQEFQAVREAARSHRPDDLSSRAQLVLQRRQALAKALSDLRAETVADLDALLANLDATTTRQAVAALGRIVRALLIIVQEREQGG